MRKTEQTTGAMMKMKTKWILMASLMAGVGFGLQAADKVEKRGDPAEPKPYPMETCLVSGEKLGSMGEPVEFVHEGREVRLCCKGCRKDFDADSAKWMAKVDEAAKLVRAYPLKTCVVSGEELGSMGKPVVWVRERQEVRLCCKGCMKEFEAQSKQYLSALKEAGEKAAKEKH